VYFKSSGEKPVSATEARMPDCLLSHQVASLNVNFRFIILYPGSLAVLYDSVYKGQRPAEVLRRLRQVKT